MAVRMNPHLNALKFFSIHNFHLCTFFFNFNRYPDISSTTLIDEHFTIRRIFRRISVPPRKADIVIKYFSIGSTNLIRKILNLSTSDSDRGESLMVIDQDREVEVKLSRKTWFCILVFAIGVILGAYFWQQSLDPTHLLDSGGPCVIAGRVTDKKTGAPIVNATVAANGFRTTTREDGYYSLNAEAGLGMYYTITVSAKGYEEKSEMLAEVEYVGKTYTVNFELTQS